MSRLLFCLVAVAGCYHPEPQDKAFRCDAEHRFICPDGLVCDEVEGFCVRKLPHHDLGFPDLSLTQDASVISPPDTCGDRIKAGSFGGLTNLSAVNGAGDERGMAVTNDGKRLYYRSGGTLMTAALTSPKTAAAPEVVSVTGVSSISGLAFAADGSLYVSASDGVTPQIFQMAVGSATQIALMGPHLPAGLCTIGDIAFVDGDITKELYISYPLAGCHMPEGRGSYIAQGLLDKQMGAFIAALPSSGYRSPYVVTGGRTMILSSEGASAARLYYAERPSNDATWTGPSDLPLAGIGGPGASDVQAVVSPDCSTLYLSSERAGGKGGLDLWAADIINP